MEVEVTRFVLARTVNAGQNARVEKINMHETPTASAAARTDIAGGVTAGRTGWSHRNGIAKLKWTVQLEPKATTELSYDWHYFWR